MTAVEATAAAIAATSKASGTAKATPPGETATTKAAHATTLAKAAAAATAEAASGEAIHAHFNRSAVPFVAIELLDSVVGIVGMIVNYNAGTLGSVIRSHVDIRTMDSADTSY